MQQKTALRALKKIKDNLEEGPNSNSISQDLQNTIITLGNYLPQDSEHIKTLMGAIPYSDDIRLEVLKDIIDQAIEEIECGINSDENESSRENAITKEKGAEKSKRVWVIHGRNEKLKENVFQFLRAIGLEPIEWSEAQKMTGKSSPYIGEILNEGFNYAQAFVVLLTGDDEARLRNEFIRKDDLKYEKTLMPQPRQNVVFEAGMAFGRDPNRVVFVKQGEIRPFSNISGIHILELDNEPGARMDFADRLKTAGCDIPDLTTKRDWINVGYFNSDLKRLSEAETKRPSGNFVD